MTAMSSDTRGNATLKACWDVVYPTNAAEFRAAWRDSRFSADEAFRVGMDHMTDAEITELAHALRVASVAYAFQERDLIWSRVWRVGQDLLDDRAANA